MDEKTVRALHAPYGSTVRYVTKAEQGIGELTLVWYGVCEVLNVKRQDGTAVHVYPDLGDTAEVLPSSGAPG